MNLLIAPDKFKGTLTAQQVCDCIEKGLLQKDSSLNIRKFPLADGGDGTLDLLLHHLSGRRIEVEVFNPLFSKIKSSYGLSQDGKTAIIEMANASGLRLLTEDQQNVLMSSTYGTGELIRHALDQSVKKIILGIGGSATNDAGLGAAQALGFRFYNNTNELVTAVGKNLKDIIRIDNEMVHPLLKSVSITAICDVRNPFYGPEGAAYTYAAQKGADTAGIQLLDNGLNNIAQVFLKYNKTKIQNQHGSGAGGGFAGGAMALLGADLKSGVETIFEVTQFEDAIKKADVVITGEGKIDKQTLNGKLLMGISQLAKKYNKRLMVIAGQSELTDEQTNELGIQSVHTLESCAGASKAITDAENVLTELSKNLLLIS
jgi:glycerate kinase